MGQLKVVLPYDNWLTVVNVTGEVWNFAALNKLELNRIWIGDPTLTPTFVNEFNPWFVQQQFGGHYLKQVLWIENDHEGKPKTGIPRRMIRKRTSLTHTIKTDVLKQKLKVPVLKENSQADKKTRDEKKRETCFILSQICNIIWFHEELRVHGGAGLKSRATLFSYWNIQMEVKFLDWKFLDCVDVGSRATLFSYWNIQMEVKFLDCVDVGICIHILKWMGSGN